MRLAFLSNQQFFTITQEYNFFLSDRINPKDLIWNMLLSIKHPYSRWYFFFAESDWVTHAKLCIFHTVWWWLHCDVKATKKVENNIWIISNSSNILLFLRSHAIRTFSRWFHVVASDLFVLTARADLLDTLTYRATFDIWHCFMKFTYIFFPI